MVRLARCVCFIKTGNFEKKEDAIFWITAQELSLSASPSIVSGDFENLFRCFSTACSLKGEALCYILLSIPIPTCTFSGIFKNRSGTKFIFCDTEF